MEIVIERAKAQDAGQLLAYLKKVGAETDNLTFGAEGLPFSVESEAAYLSQLEGSCDEVLLLAKADGMIIGSASLTRLPRRMRHRGEMSVTVLKQYWNRGIGAQLMEHLIAYARDNAFEIIDLQVRSDNLAAIHLYQKYGFRVIGTHPSFFKLGDLEIPFDYMSLSLI